MRPSILLIALLLTGCGHITPLLQPSQANLLQPCPVETPQLAGTTGADLMQALMATAAQAKECAIRHNSLIDVINTK